MIQCDSEQVVTNINTDDTREHTKLNQAKRELGPENKNKDTNPLKPEELKGHPKPALPIYNTSYLTLCSYQRVK